MKRSSLERKWVELDELLPQLALEREAGRRIGFSNGCFDLLHRGHLHLLSTASTLADILVIGVNGDASVRRLKGNGRPVQPLPERVRGLANLDEVAWIVDFDTDTPLELIEAIQPDVLIKGDDYPPDGIVGRGIVEARGGAVVRVPRLAGHSTTERLADPNFDPDTRKPQDGH